MTIASLCHDIDDPDIYENSLNFASCRLRQTTRKDIVLYLFLRMSIYRQRLGGCGYM